MKPKFRKLIIKKKKRRERKGKRKKEMGKRKKGDLEDEGELLEPL